MAKSVDKSQFKVTDDGVFCDDIKISEYIKIVGFVTTLAEKSWKTRLEFSDMNGDKCLMDVDNEKLSNVGDLIKELVYKGMCPDIDSKRFKKYLLRSFRNRASIQRYIEVSQTGWIDGTSYLCPGEQQETHRKELLRNTMTAFYYLMKSGKLIVSKRSFVKIEARNL